MALTEQNDSLGFDCLALTGGIKAFFGLGFDAYLSDLQCQHISDALAHWHYMRCQFWRFEYDRAIYILDCKTGVCNHFLCARKKDSRIDIGKLLFFR